MRQMRAAYLLLLTMAVAVGPSPAARGARPRRSKRGRFAGCGDGSRAAANVRDPGFAIRGRRAMPGVGVGSRLGGQR